MKTTSNPSNRPVRRDRRIQERIHDTYRSTTKLREPTVCEQCGAVFEAGRWGWGSAPSDAHKDTCPACHRIADNYPAGLIDISGGFLPQHLDEILNLIRNEADKESREHPLKRIIGIEETDNGVQVSTTDLHLARSIGDALRRAYAGKLEYEYTKGGDLLRVSWVRIAGGKADTRG